MSEEKTRVPNRPEFELIDKDGNHVCYSSKVETLANLAKHHFPDQEQDPERTGKGWDVQVLGSGQ